MLLLLGVLFVLDVARDTVGVSVIFGLLSTAVASGVGYLTARTSGNAQVKVAQTTTRGQVEEEAYERARQALGEIIDRQEAQITGQDAKLARQEKEISDLEERLEHVEERVRHAEADARQANQKAEQYRRQAQRLARALYELRHGGVQAAPDPAVDEAVIDLLGEDPAGA
jgi:predicted RNase H-like nuclease (RuvC/YqgF family)